MNYLRYCETYRESLRYLRVTVLDVETYRIPSFKNGETLFTHRPTFLLGGTLDLKVGYNFFKSLYSFTTALSGSVVAGEILVGHNLAYDLLYAGTAVDRPNLMIWDTMLATYLLSDQEMIMPSLEDSLDYFGIVAGKTSTVSEHLKSGGCLSSLPSKDVETYLRQDLNITKELFKKQFELFNEMEPAWQNMFITQMLFCINTFRASLAGMYVDAVKTVRDRRALSTALEHKQVVLRDAMENVVAKYKNSADKGLLELNPDSPGHWSVILGGGSIDAVVDTPTGDVYKTGPKAGKLKTKKEKYAVEFEGYKWFLKGSSVDKAAIKEICKRPLRPVAVKDVLLRLLEYRDLAKTVGTYYNGYMAMAKYDGCIHPTYNHCVTPTGRLSCSKPNLQNIKGD